MIAAGDGNAYPLTDIPGTLHARESKKDGVKYAEVALDETLTFRSSAYNSGAFEIEAPPPPVSASQQMQNGSDTTNTNTLLDASNSIRDFLRHPKRSIHTIKRKLSRKFLEDDDEVGPRDSYHYASVAISGNSKNPFSIYDSDDEDDEIIMDTAGKRRGVNYFEDSKADTVGEETINVFAFSSLVFITTSVFLSSTLSALPPIILIYGIIHDIAHRWFLSLPLAVLRLVDNMCAAYMLTRCKNPLNVGKPRAIIPVMIISILEIIMYGHYIPLVYIGVREYLFVEPDGSPTIEWQGYNSYFFFAVLLGYGVMILRSLLVLAGIGISISSKYRTYNSDLNFLSTAATRKLLEIRESWLWFRFHLYYLNMTLFLSVILFSACLASACTYVWSWDQPSETSGGQCDMLDETECMLPFPSSYFLKEDESSETGYRINLAGECLSLDIFTILTRDFFKHNGEKLMLDVFLYVHLFRHYLIQPMCGVADTLFKLKGGESMHPGFLNKMDGFSTMSPILFYLDGLKEGGSVGLQGPDNIEDSLTAKSITLLLDVESAILLPHFSEIDFLDEERPLVIMQPASPLQHNRIYAVLLHNAIGKDDALLEPTPGFKAIFSGDVPSESQRSEQFTKTLLPAFTKAAPWLEHKIETFQLMFDFHTASAENQLGHVRGVRDAVLSSVRKDDWDFDVKVNRVINFNCAHNDIARTVHSEFKVPWYLENHGDGYRSAKMNQKSITSPASSNDVAKGVAKFVVHVPCSVKINALEGGGGKEVRTIVDFGHGLFGSREESSEATFLHQMADDNGYLIIAMDWRGMSQFDMPVILNMLIADPLKIEVVRDNIIQGYANKIALQEFASNGLLEMESLKFGGKKLRLLNDLPPSTIFYGISMGGILGGGYTALMGSTEIIDRSILGVPGTPFSLILSRSEDFYVYNQVMLLNFYHNRHVRMFLSIFQLAIDSVGAGGHLAGPTPTENIPRVLIQAGLGDTQVTTIAAEILARSFGASLLPNSPRNVFGLDSNATDPKSALTELLYQREATSLPKTNKFPERNNVHFCVRKDWALRNQIIQFINFDKITNPCADDQCVRQSAAGC